MPKAEAQSEWAVKAKNVLKAELKRKGVSYRDLSERLSAMGTPLTEQGVNKIVLVTLNFNIADCDRRKSCSKLKPFFPAVDGSKATKFSSAEKKFCFLVILF